MAARSGGSVWRVVREGGAPPPPDALGARSRPFGSAVARAGTLTLLAVRQEAGVASFVTATGAGGERAARALAAAVGGRLEAVDGLPELAAETVGTLVARPRAEARRASQYGADPAEVAATIGRVLQPGQWVAVSLRSPTRAETSACHRWFAHRLAVAGASATHYSTEMDSLVGTFRAGAGRPGEVTDLLSAVAASIPGLDVDTGVGVASGRAAGGMVGAAGVIAGAALGFGAHSDPAGAVVAALGAGFGAAIGTGRVPSAATRLAERVAAGVLPGPPRRRIPPFRPRRESVDSQGRRRPSRPGSYPLARNVFLLGPAMPLGVVSPHSAESATVSATRMRSAPEALLADIGPLVGYAGDGGTQTVHLSAEDLWTGVAAIGDPGSGKTAALGGLWTWLAAQRSSPHSRYRGPGRDNTLICFETKADGVAGWEQGLAAAGDRWVVVELADPDSPAVGMLAAGDTPAASAELFVSAMTYAYGDGAIQGRATEALTAMLTATLAADLDTAWAAVDSPERPNPMLAAHVLLGGWGDQPAKDLALAILDQANAQRDDPDLAAAARALQPFFSNATTPAQRRTLTESSRNKTNLLVKAGSWWDPARPRVEWGDVLERHWAVILNTGASSPSSRNPGRLVDETLTTRLTAMLTYLLRTEVTRTCAGWQAAGRSVSIFADELSELAGASPEVVSWFRDRGRSYGVIPVFATQRPGQLDVEVRNALLGFGNVVWYTQSSPAVARTAAEHLSVSGGDYTDTDLMTMERFHAALRATAGGRAQPPVTVRVAYWPDRRAQLAEAGFGSPGGPASELAAGAAGPAPAVLANPYSTGPAG